MDTLFDFDAFESTKNADTQLILNINADAEQDFLSKIGGMNARKRDIAALVDQYNGTNVKTLCFAGSNKQALAVWAERCHVLGITALQTVKPEDCTEITTNLLTDGLLIDCRNEADLSFVCDIAEKTDAMLYLLLSKKTFAEVLNEEICGVVQGIVLYAARYDDLLPDAQWLSEQKDFSVFVGVSEILCNASGKAWLPTPEIMNGITVEVLSKGCNGLFLDGFCADIMNPDTMLYDIYENCACLQECVGAKRRHLLLVNAEKVILPGAVYHFGVDIKPVFKGAPLCLVIAVEGATVPECLCILCDANDTQYTGNPVVIARDMSGKLRENRCVDGDVTFFEYYLGNAFDGDAFEISIRSNSKKDIILRWAEISVNI